MSFKLWSELNNEVLQNLKPDLGLRNWGDLSKTDKNKIWKYLEFNYFFTKEDWADTTDTFDFDSEFFDGGSIAEIIQELNNLYKAMSFGNCFLENKTDHSACLDFHRIFMEQDENVVIEMLSLTARKLIHYRVGEVSWNDFDKFSYELNDIFIQFGLNLTLTRLGFMPRQDEEILADIYEPVIKILSHLKWEKVSQHLKDAFAEYRKNTENGYSNCVTNAVTAIQAYLQIIVNGDTGSGDISSLIKIAQKDNQIPSDAFSRTIFKNIESVLMQERQDTGIAHPKKEYATEKSARLVLNISMIFFQHCIL